jgi:hypothetical protein
VAQIFFAARNHWITNEKDITDIDIRVVKCAMDMKGIPIEEQWGVYQRVRTIFHVLLKDQQNGG